VNDTETGNSFMGTLSGTEDTLAVMIPATDLTLGTHTFAATYLGDSNYTIPASYQIFGSYNVTVVHATPAITWAPATSIVYGTSLANRLNASASNNGLAVAGSFTYTATPQGGTSSPVTASTVLTAGTYTLTASFAPADSTDFTLASPSVALTVTQATPTLTWATPTAIIYGTALSSTQLDATSTVSGTFNYAPAAGTVLTAGTQTLSVIFTPTDTTDYSTATSSVTLTVDPASESIIFGSIASQVVGNTVNLSASSTSGLAVSFASTTPSVCSTSGTTATMTGVGTCTIAATQAGNANYTAAIPVSVSFIVSGFNLVAMPSSETIHRGILAAFLLEAQSLNGFWGDVKITCSGGPSNSVCGDFPQTVKVLPNKVALAISGVLFPKNTSSGTYTLTFTGTSGSAVVSTTAQFKVED
jgi:large repetitive protein